MSNLKKGDIPKAFESKISKDSSEKLISKEVQGKNNRNVVNKSNVKASNLNLPKKKSKSDLKDSYKSQESSDESFDSKPSMKSNISIKKVAQKNNNNKLQSPNLKIKILTLNYQISKIMKIQMKSQLLKK